MQSVSRKEILNTVSENQNQHQQIELILDQVFDSLRWTQVVEGTVIKVSSLDVWKHRSISEIEADLYYLEIDRSTILLSLSEYLSNDSLTSNRLDWLFLNVLIYAEYIATLSEIRNNILGSERYINRRLIPSAENITDISHLTKRSWHLPVCLAISGISWAIYPALSVAVTAYFMYTAYKSRKVVKKIDIVLASMFQTYLSFNTVDFSWSHGIFMLESSRNAGVVWDASIFALVERRTSAMNT